jgi:hypothetical protein
MIRAAQLVGLGSGHVALSGGAAGLVRSSRDKPWARFIKQGARNG